MRISAISFYSLNRKQLNNNHTTKVSENLSCLHLNKPVSGYFPYYLPLNFNGNVLSSIMKRRDLQCLCCHKAMLPQDDYRKLIANPKLLGTCKEAIEVLSEFEDYLHDAEKQVFKLIKDACAEDPTKKATLSKIVKSLRPESLKKLQENELQILMEIESLGKNLSPHFKSKLTDFILKYKKSVLNEDKFEPFKRKKFISNLYGEIINPIPNKFIKSKIIGKSIMKTADKLNSLENDVNVFIVKHFQQNSEEIARELFFSSVMTKEHLVAQELIKKDVITQELIKEFSEANKEWDIGLTCRQCNENKKNDEIPKWAEDNPEMCKENAQFYFDDFMNLILEGKIPPEYIGTLIKNAQILVFMSNNKIKIDMSKLKKVEALLKNLELQPA